MIFSFVRRGPVPGSPIQAALAVNPDAAPEHRLENVLMQRRAAWMASQADHWFLPPLPPLPPDEPTSNGVNP